MRDPIYTPQFVLNDNFKQEQITAVYVLTIFVKKKKKMKACVKKMSSLMSKKINK